MEKLMQKIQRRQFPDTSTPDFDRSVEEDTCPYCRGCGVQMIKDEKGYEFAHACICAIKKRTEKYLTTSGISEAFRRKTLKNSSVAGKPEVIQKAKAVAREYVKNYFQIKKTNTNSIGFFGTDKRIMFGIINHRYNECKPVLVSSELFPEQIKDLDEGIGSRIIENCRGRMIKFNDPGLNNRLYG